MEQASSFALRRGLPARITGSAGAGVLFMGLPDRLPAAELAALLADLRPVAMASVATPWCSGRELP